MITHEIPHIFRVQKRWNRKNRTILSILNLRSKSARFSEHPVTSFFPIGTIAETEPEDEDEHLEISDDDDNSEDLQLMTSDHDLNSKVYR